jgi:hypothetical protein
LNHANLGLLIDVLHFNRSRVNLEELTVRRGSSSTSRISATRRNITEALIQTAREQRRGCRDGLAAWECVTSVYLHNLRSLTLLSDS